MIICKDKGTFDISAAKAKLEKSLKQNFYYAGREWPYKNVKPKIIAEKYMEDSTSKELKDYKFFTFNGAPRIMFVASVSLGEIAKNETRFFIACNGSGFGLAAEIFLQIFLHSLIILFSLTSVFVRQPRGKRI